MLKMQWTNNSWDAKDLCKIFAIECVFGSKWQVDDTLLLTAICTMIKGELEGKNYKEYKLNIIRIWVVTPN